MTFAHYIQIISLSVFLILMLLLAIKRKDFKKFVPIGLFVIVYGDIWCFIADYFKLWSYPTRIFPSFTVASIPFNYFALPVLVILWLMFCPSSAKGKIIWAVTWSAFLVGIEFILTRYTKILS